jgi:hypothetical protein
MCQIYMINLYTYNLERESMQFIYYVEVAGESRGALEKP